MKCDKKRAVDIIITAAQNYKKYLQDKNFLILYQEAKLIKSVQVEFRDNHFLHLTGINS